MPSITKGEASSVLGFSLLETVTAAVAVVAATMVSDEATFTSLAMISVVVDLVASRASTATPVVAAVAAAVRARLIMQSRQWECESRSRVGEGKSGGCVGAAQNCV